jgi:hypothetical protein
MVITHSAINYLENKGFYVTASKKNTKLSGPILWKGF